MKRFVLGAAALLALALPASAQTGCYVGALGGYSASNTDVGIGGGGYELIGIDGLGTDGVAGGLQVGCDYRVADRFVIGAFADYLRHDQDFKAGLFDNEITGQYDIEDQWSIGARAGALASPDTLVYVLAAYTRAKTSDFSISGGGKELFRLDLNELDGWTVGGGIETRVWGNVYLGAEARYTQFDGEDYKVEGIDVSTDTDMLTGLATLKWKWGPTPAGSPLLK